MPWIAASSVAGLVGLMLVERLLPILPSYGLLVAVGVAVGEGYWSLPLAFALTVVGGIAGCALFYALGWGLGEARAGALLRRTAGLFGMAPARVDHWITWFRDRGVVFAFVAQLVPTVRLVVPGIAGLLRTHPVMFFTATALGIGLWNGLFIGTGYAAASLVEASPNASSIALTVLVALVLLELMGTMMWRSFSRRRQAVAVSSAGAPPALGIGLAPRPSTGPSRRQDAADDFAFFRAWLKAPLRVAAVVPSGRALAAAITAEIGPDSAPVIELGPGTGAFTRALIGRGVPEARLALVEAGPEFAALLRERFPAAQVLCMDAARLGTADPFGGEKAGAVVSGLPVLSMPPKAVIGILDGAFRHLRPDGAFYQFTYGPRCPIPRAILDRLGLKAVRIGRAVANVPPAAVYRITRRWQRPPA
ncbi:VTT domain-containing protein [Inquilinus limosus]|uniref:VTT domain-containing protein n=1 Tax=Inquilinus limosus TaxID=171674 RepID=UPI0004147F89|nr:VTT domain-containing protein [Inquilinus limosus]